MRTNPFLDSFYFLIGQTPDHDALGLAKYGLVVLYWVALIGGIAVAVRAWADEPEQLTFRNVVIWLFRMLIGTMWLQASLWKLPLPVSGAFNYWLGQVAQNSWVPAQVHFVRDLLLPHIDIVDPIIFVIETLLGFSLMLGFGVRVAGWVGILFTLNLWLGLYHRGDEWPWNYVFLIFLHGFFVLDRAGECLGLDGILWHRPLVRKPPSYVR